MGALLLAACNNASSTPAPQATEAPTSAAETEAATAAPPAEETEAPAQEAATPEPAAEASAEGRVAAPTFDPAVNQIALEPFLEGFDQPLLLTHAGDESGRIFVVEKAGIIRIVSNSRR